MEYPKINHLSVGARKKLHLDGDLATTNEFLAKFKQTSGSENTQLQIHGASQGNSRLAGHSKIEL